MNPQGARIEPVLRSTSAGDDVVWIKEAMPGAEDPVVLAQAQTEQRVVVTADTDFG